jgi:D-aspartate ligase
MAKASPPAAVLLGGGVNGLVVARRLGRRGIPITLVEADPNDLANKSRFVSAFLRADPQDQGLLESLLRLPPHEDDLPVLLYTSDRFLKFVSEHRDALATRFRFVIADSASVHNVVDKAAFASFTDEHGFPAPRTLFVSPDSPWSEIDQLTFPVLIKPTLSYEWRNPGFAEQFGRVKVLPATSPQELRSLLARLKHNSSHVVIQEMIVGDDDSHYSVVCYRSGIFGEFAQMTYQKIRLWPVGNGAASLARLVSSPEMETISRDLLDALGWVGVASVCFKIDQRTGRPMIHEVNGRMPQMHGTSQIINVDLPYLTYLDSLQQQPPTIERRVSSKAYRIFSMDCAALMAYLGAGTLTRQQAWRALLRLDLVAEFAWDDWRPGLSVLRKSLPTLIKGLASRPIATPPAIRA